MNAHQRRKARRASKPDLRGLILWWKDGKNMLPPPAMQLHGTRVMRWRSQCGDVGNDLVACCEGHAPTLLPGGAR